MLSIPKEKLLFYYRVLLSVMLIVSGLCLMVVCVAIYLSGDKPFSPQSVADGFSGIAIPIFCTLALILLGFVLDLLFPTQKKKLSAGRQNSLILKRLLEKHDLNAMDSQLKTNLQREQKHVLCHKSVTLLLLAAGSLVFLIHALNPANFSQTDINSSILQASVLMCGCLALPFAYGVFSVAYEKKSLQRQIDIVRQAVEAGCPKQAAAPEAVKAKFNVTQFCRWALLAVAIGFAVYGFIAGGTLDVLTKAINICTECVGLG